MPTTAPSNTGPPHAEGADRNLLFGILAAQMDFISRDDLLAGMNAWILDKAKPLGEILVERKLLDARHRELLEPLVAAHVRGHGNDAQTSLAALSVANPWREALEGVPDTDVAASLAHLPSERVSDNELSTIAVSSSGALYEATRFRVLRPHAKGGLGWVFIAEDLELHREVALKEIQTPHADDPASRARFVLEAEITGALEHPGIVPVYGLGQHKDGRPFYAMRFIRGDSLQEAVDDFHRRQETRVAYDSAEFRKLLGRFVDVCDAIAYAHSRGVLHRDLKPGNIMLGKFGETLVVDWGLAKVQGRGESAEPSENDCEATLRPPTSLGSSFTQMKQVVGTPSYMSPEQAEGRLDLLGAASDVYSLGATLYYVLTGRAPFGRDEQVGRVLRRVAAGEFPPPRAIKGEIPKRLEAICLRAMSRRGDDRYAGPHALADDLENYLADAPLAALPDSWSDKFSRFARRNRTLVRTVAAALAVVAILATVAALIVTRLAEEKGNLAKRNAALYRSEHRARSEASKAAKREKAARLAADTKAAEARASLYLSQMRVLDNAMSRGAARQARPILERYREVKAGESDLRGWEWYFVDRQIRQELLTFPERVEGARSLIFSHQGRYLSCGASDGVVRIFDAATGERKYALRGHSSAVRCVSFNRDDSLLASGDETGAIKVWSTADGQEVQSWQAHEEAVVSLSFLPLDDRLASVGFLHAIKIWDASTGVLDQELIGDLVRRGSCLAGLSFSPDGRLLATGGDDFWGFLWDVDGGRIIGQLHGHDDSIRSVRFSPAGKLLASASDDGSAVVWNMDQVLAQPHTGGKLQATPKVLSHEQGKLAHVGSARSLGFSANGQWLATGGADGAIRVWDSRTGLLLQTFFASPAEIESIAVSPDGWRLASVDRDGRLRLWHPRRGGMRRKLFAHGAPVHAVAVGPAGRWVASAAYDGSASVFELPVGSRIQSLPRGSLGASPLCLSPQGDLLARLNEAGSVTLWKTDSWSLVAECEAVFAQPSALAFSPDGESIVGGGMDGRLVSWSVATGKVIWVQPAHAKGLRALAFAPDGRQLASVGGLGELKVWRQPGMELAFAPIDGGQFRTIRFSPDGRSLAAGSDDRSMSVFDSRSGKRLHSTIGHAAEVSAIAFASNGRRIVSGSRDGVIKFWDIASFEEVFTLGEAPIAAAPVSRLQSLSLDANGRWLATANQDGSLSLWDAREKKDANDEAYAAEEFYRTIWDSSDSQAMAQALAASIGGISEGLRQRMLALAENHATRTIPQRTPARATFAIEGENAHVLAPSGHVSAQDMSGFPHDVWSGDRQLFWAANKPGDALELELSVPISGEIEIRGRLTLARDFGVFQAYLDDEKLGAPLDLYNHPLVVASGLLSLGKRRLSQGEHRLRFECLGSNPAAVQNHMFGLDYLLLSIEPNLAYRRPDDEFPKASTSYAFDFDPPSMVNDGFTEFRTWPNNRWTAYRSPNPQDWLEIEFERETEFASLRLAIYDDTPGSRDPYPNGAGVVGAPETFAVEYWAGEEWKPVIETSRYPAKPTGWQWNVVDFEKVKSNKVRVVFTHAKGYFSGVTEMEVWPEAAGAEMNEERKYRNDPLLPRPAEIPIDWRLRYFSWENAGVGKPPADWSVVVAASPLAIVEHSELRYNWDLQSPCEGVPADLFALVAEGEFDAEAGDYEFLVICDDGVRVYLDDEKVLENWAARPAVTERIAKSIADGRHKLRVEYFEKEAQAVLIFHLTRKQPAKVASGK